MALLQSFNSQNGTSFRERTQAWWTMDEHLPGPVYGTGNRVFNHPADNDVNILLLNFTVCYSCYDELNKTVQDVWDLSDSLAELYDTYQRKEGNASKGAKSGSRKKAPAPPAPNDVMEWIHENPAHGWIRIYSSGEQTSSKEFNVNNPQCLRLQTGSQLVPVTLSTTAHKVALMIGMSVNALHVQFNGDVIRRLDPYEHPLVLQNTYLTSVGFGDVTRIQEEGAETSLQYLVKFYAGKFFYAITSYTCGMFYDSFLLICGEINAARN